MTMWRWKSQVAVIACECSSCPLIVSPLSLSQNDLYGVYANNYCSFCGQDEDHDPSEEFEEYLTCAVCGDHCMFICGLGIKLSKPYLSVAQLLT